MIDPKFLCTITWTGKSDSKAKKKIKFESYTEIIGLINEVCVAADRKYSNVQCRIDMVYKIFKYAYRNKSDNDSEGTKQKASSLTKRNIPISTASTEQYNNHLLMPQASVQSHETAHQPLQTPSQPLSQTVPQQQLQPMPHEFPPNSNFHQASAHQVPSNHSHHLQPMPHEFQPNSHLPYNKYPPVQNGNYPPMQNNNGWPINHSQTNNSNKFY